MKRRVLSAAIVILWACSAPDAGAPGGPPRADAPCEGLAPVALDALFAAHFEASRPTGCSANGCHGTGAGGLAFTNAHELWAATLERPSVMAPGRKLVVPGDPAASELLRRLMPDAPNRMPMGGPFLDDAALRDLAAWICAGAPEPSHPSEQGDGGTTPDAGSDTFEITVISPASGVAGTLVTIDGRGFDPEPDGNEVRFGPARAAVTSASASQLVVTVPEGASSGPVVVVAFGRTATSPVPFQVIVPHPVPVASAAVPSSIVAGSPDTALRVEGASFVEGATVLWDGEPLATTFADVTRLAALVPASRLLHAGSHAVSVVNPGPGGGTSAAVPVSVENPVPGIVRLLPERVLVGQVGVTLGVEGVGIVADTRLLIDGAPVSSIAPSSGQLETVLPDTLTATASTHTISLENPAPGGGAASAVFTVANPPPALTSLSRERWLLNETAPALELFGAEFVATTRVELDGVALPTTVVSPSALSASLPAGFTAVAATHLVAVVTPAPGGGRTPERAVVVENPLPEFISASPAKLDAGQGDQRIVVTGAGLLPVTSVRANGVELTPTLVGGGLELTVPGALLSATGTLALVPENPGPGGGVGLPWAMPIENPAPVASALVPERVVAQGTPVTVTASGSGFVSATAATFDGSGVASVVLDKGLISFEIPGALLAIGGVHEVRLNSPGPGGGVSAPLTFTALNPSPAISALSPANVAEGVAFTLTVDGSGFNAATTATLDGSPVHAIVSSATRLVVDVPALPAGSHAVEVQNPGPGGGSDVSSVVASVSAAPFVSGLSPAAGPARTAFRLTVTGTNFRCSGAASVVHFGSLVLTPVACSPTQLAVDVPSSLAGPYAVSVKNGGIASNAVTFDVLEPNPVPVLQSLSPEVATAGAAGLDLTVSGTGFVAGSSVLVDGTPRATAFLSSTQLRAALSADDLATVRRLTVAVSSPAPGGGTSGPATLPVVAPNPIPSLGAASPSSVEAGSGAVVVRVSGSGFVSGAQGLFDGTARPTTFFSSSQLAIALTSADTAASGTHTLTVENPAPGGGTSGGVSFVVVATHPVPVIDGLAPSSAVTGSNGISLVVTGTGFVPASVVSFDGRSRTTTYGSATRLTATLPASDLAAAGSYPVTVTSPTPGGGTSSALSFVVVDGNPVPAITASSPASVVAGAGAVTLTLSGTGFIAGTAVTVDGGSRVVTVESPTQLRLELTSGDTASAGTLAIVPTNPAPGGGSGTAFALTVVAPNPMPVLGSLAPASVAVGAAAFTLAVSGTGFVSGSRVLWGGAERATTFVSASRLDAAIGSADTVAAGAFDVAVRSPAPGGGKSGSLTFFVNNPVPVLSALSPASTSAGAGAVTVTLSGSGFVATSSATVDGAVRTTRFINATQLAVDLVAADTSGAGTRRIVVANPGPGGGTSSALSFDVTAAPNPAPSITTLSPCGTVAGRGAFTLTIDGSGFTSGTTVSFNGAAVTPTIVSSTRLTAAIPAAATASAPSNDAVTVAVSNAAPGGGSAAATFGVATQAVTSTQVQDVISRKCAGCHGFSPAGWKDRPSGGCPSSMYVKSCGPLPTQSYIVARITSQASLCGSSSRMPPSGMTAADQQLIIDWAAQGAP